MGKSLFLLAICLMFHTALSAQDAASSGTPFNGLVTDRQGKGIKAKISVKHSDKRTIADREGKFGLTDLSPDDTLVMRFKSDVAEIPLEGRRSLKVVWEGPSPACEEDQELVDCGIGYVKRREYTSSSTGITGKMMLERGYTDLQSAVLNLIPSLQLINGEIVIRGVKSVNSKNGALIICDGSPVNSLNAVSIYDVKSVEVQKGSNMYGMRGANGVIIIRTRD
ncbi:TonB-dependent receptor plug domain-containing protein [Alistipes sp.]|uniref:TonB-dependent receptor plug domain-containing protein n=1 Tax=Alistipes sp. TaxID=1872444 RepID=UPI003AF07D8A